LGEGIGAGATYGRRKYNKNGLLELSRNELLLLLGLSIIKSGFYETEPQFFKLEETAS
jgi:hypothetical protein